MTGCACRNARAGPLWANSERSEGRKKGPRAIGGAMRRAAAGAKRAPPAETAGLEAKRAVPVAARSANATNFTDILRSPVQTRGAAALQFRPQADRRRPGPLCRQFDCAR